MATYLQQMVEKITRIKELSKEWGQKHKVHYQKELIETEQKIQEIYSSNKSGIFTNEELESLNTK